MKETKSPFYEMFSSPQRFFILFGFFFFLTTSVPDEGYYVPNEGYYVPNKGYYVPNEGYYVPNEGYYVPNEGYGVPNKGYYRNASCTLSYISTFVFF